MGFTLSTTGLLSQLIGDSEVAEYFSDRAELEAVLKFETALAKVQAAQGLIPGPAALEITALCTGFDPDWEALGARTAQDGLSVPGLVSQLRDALSPEHASFLHFKTTSQDAIDTSLMLRLTKVLDLLSNRIDGILNGFTALQTNHGNLPLMAHTRMQPALPITMGDRIENWTGPIRALREEVNAAIKPKTAVQLAGPVGRLDFDPATTNQLRKELAAALGLSDPGGCWQTDRARIVDLATWFSKLCNALGKIGQDVALMAQAKPPMVTLKGGGTSSAMAHKRNPIPAEILVTLARYAAVQAGGLHTASLHEQERSGAAWSLEWMLLPPLVLATGAATINARMLIDAMRFPNAGDDTNSGSR